jgi:hypothetical protein
LLVIFLSIFHQQYPKNMNKNTSKTFLAATLAFTMIAILAATTTGAAPIPALKHGNWDRPDATNGEGGMGCRPQHERVHRGNAGVAQTRVARIYA